MKRAYWKLRRFIGSSILGFYGRRDAERFCRIFPDLSDYEKSFEDRRASFPMRINHEMALPHRRSPDELAQQRGALTWFDFQVSVVLGSQTRYPGGILLRFVWDGLSGEWFLARAVTIYPDHFDLRSSRCALLF